MLIDVLFDRFVTRLRKSPRRQYGEGPNQTTTSRSKMKSRGCNSGMFSGANNFVMHNPTFNDHSQITQNSITGKPGPDSVFKLIVPYTDLDATMDSSARFPPPTCHPGTRLKIGDRLFTWLMNHRCQWNMIWLHGPAGTGKSAVAQTFAERCAENGRLGASFFFSRPNNRNNPNTVIPSLVYQLAVCLPHYKALVTAQLANDPELLWKARRTLFKKLIVEPLSQLQDQGWEGIREPLLVVLDGLDECEGENAQREIIEMISGVVRLKHDFPLVWLICSRSEAHLKYLFSKADFTVTCGREELVLDAESIADVDLYLRDGLAGIQDHFPDLTTPTWPSEKQFTELSQKASGHFAFASTALRYIGDLTYAAPMARLDDLLSFLAGVRVGPSNPLEVLDALYTRILRDIPDENLPTIKLMLGFYMYALLSPSAIVCNLFSIDQATFYHAFRKLHSVIDVPHFEAAHDTHLCFYHASFSDYLCDSSRSGQFLISENEFLSELAKSCLFWYKTDLALFHITDGPVFNASHLHGSLPDLAWVSDDNRAKSSNQIARVVQTFCWSACANSDQWDDGLLSQIQHFNFKYIRKDDLRTNWFGFVNKLWREDSSSGLIRAEPRSEVDLRLLEYMKLMIEPALSCKRATFPLSGDPDGGECFLLGYDSNAIMCWTTGHNRKGPMFGALNCDEVPSKERIDAYQAWLVEVDVW